MNLPLVHELVDGTLDDAATRRLENHIIDCAACAEEAQFVRELTEFAREMPRLVPGDRVWDAIAAEVGEGAGAASIDADLDGDVPAPAAWLSDIERRARVRVSRIAAAVLPLIGAGVLAASLGRDPVSTMVAANGSHATDVAARPAPSEASTSMPLLTGSSFRRPSEGSAAIQPIVQTQGTVQSGTGTDATPAANGTDPSALDVYGAALAVENASTSAQTPTDLDADVALERERLADAETAIRQCTDALEKNPNDARVRAALYDAYEQKVRALRSLIAAGERSGTSITASPVGYGAGR